MLDPRFKVTEVPQTDIRLSADPAREELRSIRKADVVPPSPLPDWLTAYTPEEQRAMENGTLVKYPRTKAHMELELQTFDIFFERFLDAVTVGDDLAQTIAGNPHNIDPGRFMRWIKKDPERTSRFEEAQEIATELILSKMDRIAEGVDNMEDIERSKLRLKQYEFKIKAWNKKRYGDTKQLDINMNNVIDIRALIEQRDDQLRTLEGEYVTVDAAPQLVENSG